MILENNGTRGHIGGIPLNVTLHAWPVPNLQPAFKTLNDSGPSELSDGVQVFTNHSINGFPNLNSSGDVFVDEDNEDVTDTGLTDVQTFILASVATTLPLMIVVITILCVRIAWKKYRVKKEDGYEGVLQKEESSEPSGRIRGYSLPQDLKTSESQFTVTLEDESLTTPSTQLPTLKSNGSIITMTLKNNHLIVETEETLSTPTSLKIESKGTTTRFVAPADSNYYKESDFDDGMQTCHNSISDAHYDALVHYPPEDVEYELDKGSCKTGLSQSDLSVSSTEMQNPSYRYGNQCGYDSGGFGYPEYSGYVAQVQEHFQISLPKPNKTQTCGTNRLETIEINSAFVDEEPYKNILKSDIEAFDRSMEEEKEKRSQIKQIIPENENLPSKSAKNGTTSAFSMANGVHDNCGLDN